MNAGRLGIVILILVWAILAVGCGSSSTTEGAEGVKSQGSETSSSVTVIQAPSSPSKAKFVAEVKRRCHEGSAEFRRLLKRLQSAPLPQGNPSQADAESFVNESLARGMDALAGFMARQIAELRRLGTPTEDRATLERMYSLWDQEVAFTRESADAFRSGDPARIDATNRKTASDGSGEGAKVSAELGRLQREYGIAVCGQLR